MSGEAYPTKRRHERLPITLEVNYKTEMDFLNARTRDLSAGGMFIRTLYPLPEGTELNIKFAIPEIRIDFSVTARVVWSAAPTPRGGADEAGMGINFLNMSEEKARLIKNYIEMKLAASRQN